MVLTIRNSDGELIRKLEAPATAGFHRIAWDLRYPRSKPWTKEKGDEYIVFPGPLAAPGDYVVSMAIRTNGVLEDTGQQSSIHVKLMRQNSLATASAEDVVAFGRRLDNLSRQGDGADSAIKALLLELGAIKKTLLRSSASDDLRNQARALELETKQLKLQLSGDENRAMVKQAEGAARLALQLQEAARLTACSP